MSKIVLILLLLQFVLNFAEKTILNIDPLSIHVDQQLRRLCWNQTKPLTRKYLNGITAEVPSLLNFTIFPSSSSSKDSYCIGWKEKFWLYTIRIPLLDDESFPTLNLTINFSVSLAPQLEFIRSQVARNILHLQLSPHFAGHKTNVSPICNVILVYKTETTDQIFHFVMDTGQNIFKDIKDDISYTAYYSCYNFGYDKISSQFSFVRGRSYPKELYYPLKPFVQAAFRSYSLISWTHPKTFPRSYTIIVRNSADQNGCIKIFYLFNKKYLHRDSKPKTAESECRNRNVLMEDLGYFLGTNSKIISVVLSMGSLVEFRTSYKLSIFWFEDSSQERLEENFVFYSPLPNDYFGILNAKLFDYETLKYEEITRYTSNLYQNIIPENKADSLDPIIKASYYNHQQILPSIYENPSSKSKIWEDRWRNKTVKSCLELPECSRGYFPLFYLMLTLKENEEVYTEIIEIMKNEKLEVEGLQLKLNNDALTFTVSWEIKHYPDAVLPAAYLAVIRAKEDSECYTYFIKCRTCRKKFKGNLTMVLLQPSAIFCTLKVYDDHYDASDASIKFTTLKLQPSLLYSVDLKAIGTYNNLHSFNRTLYGSVVPQERLKMFWEQYYIVVVSLTIVILVILLASVILWVILNKTRRLKKKRKINLKNNTSLKENVYDEHSLRKDDTVYEEILESSF